jgi:ribosomal protein S3
MGQKVHPLGFRVGITKKHQSQWFARFNKYKYSQSILEDRLIRDTLSKLFPELLNSTSSNTPKKRDEEISVTPRITQIKIERGLIPYEIGIQIHAENCELLKSAINNLKVKRELIVKLQKTRRYLSSLKLKLKDLTNNSQNEQLELTNSQINTEIVEQENSRFTLKKNSKSSLNNKFRVRNSKNKSINDNVGNESKRRTNLNFKGGLRPKLTKQELRRQRLIKKRLKKRQNIRSRYRQLILKGLFIRKTGNTITQKLSLKNKKSRKNFNAVNQKTRVKSSFKSFDKKGQSSQGTNSSKIKRAGALITLSPSKKQLGAPINTFSSRIKKKFVTLFIQKMNKKFLSHLKTLLINQGLNNISMSNSNLKSLPLGYSKQWDLSRLTTLKNQPIYKLNRMVVVLEQKLLLKLESLRKEFIAFGSISAQSFETLGYFQILNFLKNLKELVNKLKREQKLQLSISKNSVNKAINNRDALNNTQSLNKLKIGESSSAYLTLAETVLEKKLTNIENECSKVKLIEYIKDVVKSHRTDNVFLYLSTMSDASKDLKKIKQFTKRHANFLFGVSSHLMLANSSTTCMEKTSATDHAATDTSLGSNLKMTVQDKISERVSKVVEKSSKKTNVEKTLQDIFLEQIEKQRTMCLENLQLTPKISIKFYSVNKKTLEQKASIVSESVVDALEKRKAFRKVIKDAKESLMRSPGVKGVKIQVAGRLNGAEIARTEWVRAGRVPLQTLRANLDYSYRTANTIYGIIGVRVWIFKGYAKLIYK